MVWAIINQDISNATREFDESPSHRIVAVLGAAVVEEALLRAIEWRLRKDDKVTQRFFKPGGTLGNFQAKIQLGYLLGMYDKVAFDALSAIADLRNLFAHRLDINAFDAAAPKQTAHFARLALHKAYVAYPHPLFEGDSNFNVEQPKDLRETFVVNIKILLVLLMRDFRVHLPYSNQFHPLPPAPTVGAPVPETEEEARAKAGLDRSA